MKLLSIDYIPGQEIEALGMVKGAVVQTKHFGNGTLCSALGFAPVFFNSLKEHLSTYVTEQTERNPWNEFLKSGKGTGNRMNAEPTDKRHHTLKDTKHTCHTECFLCGHIRLVKTVGKRNREGIHCKSYSNKYTVKEKCKIKHCPLKKEKSMTARHTPIMKYEGHVSSRNT